MNNARHSISAELLDVLRCPESGCRLTAADGALLARLNQAVTDGELHNALGQPIQQALDAALVNADQTLAYPVIDHIPVMVPGEAIPLTAKTHAQATQ